MFSKVRNLITVKNGVSRISSSQLSTSFSNTTKEPGRVVFISQASDVYSNLALEDWLYRNWDFSKRHVLFLWRNSPCVVIGRHQNPFCEANIPYLESAGVPIVRRNSGGGTVYHDDGNLNCTFFTSKQSYNRRHNLSVICDALRKDFNILADINEKDDIVVNSSLKISGTAAKLGGNSAYHHCTLLVASDKMQLKLALKGDRTLKSNATKSVPSSTANLQDFAPDMTVEKLLESVGRNFLNYKTTEEDDHESKTDVRSDGFTLINPTEDWFPGLDEIKENLKSWNWFVGMTPLFKQKRPVTIDQSFSEGSAILVSIEVFHGIIKGVTVESSVSQALKEYIEKQIGNTIVGSRYAPEIFLDIESRLIEREPKPQYYSAH
ncbi:Lipoyltransferase 1, mitochondrial [Armadillidium nasatum]|uniref:Lipoyltransferase 1, mitochondrial n=1 Tax=Armadillidium nasatum TaxID=96803 RepID=A0A5N5TA34_9CRUS|nr:Lipoyltransferase 1, mitochondrial [Armadillidium nasatum]